MNCLFKPLTVAGLHHGDSRDVLKTLPDNSIDSVVTDPPYALVSIVKRFGGKNAAPSRVGASGVYARASAGFMGQSWDTGEVAFAAEFWSEVYRVLKPGGHVVSFGGTRTYHRMAVAIEDAGFEIRDQIQWLYGTGFPKSHNVFNALRDKTSDENKPIDNSEIGTILNVWRNLSDTATVAGNRLQKNPTVAGVNIVKSDSVPENVLLKINPEKSPSAVSAATRILKEVRLMSEPGTCSAQSNAEVCITASSDHVKYAEKLSGDHNPTLCVTLDSSVLRRVQDLQKENTASNLKGAEALKIWLGKRKSSGEAITLALCAALTEDLKRTILSQSKTFLNLDTKSQTDFASVTTVIITESMAESLISFTAGILRNEAEQWEGWGTALKPANEPICLARKPLEGTVAENVLKWGTGAINIDGCRIEVADGDDIHAKNPNTRGGFGHGNASIYGASEGAPSYDPKKGRFPANVITDGSVEMPNGAQRFFYSAKASKADRGEGNNHPTVKPTELMQYLCRLVTPPGGVVLDPFMGSGSTGKAAHLEGFKFVGIEREKEYFEIAKRRVTEC